MTFWQSVGKQNLLFSVTQLCPTLYDLMDGSMSGLTHISQSLPSSCPLYWWSHPAISSSDALFSFCPQSFPTSGTLPMSQLFISDDQNTVASASASVLPMSVQGWFPLRLTGLISLLYRDTQESSPAPQFKGINSLALPSFWSSCHNRTWPLRRPYTWLCAPLSAEWRLCF